MLVTPILAAIAVLGVSASGPLMAAAAAPALAIAFWRNAAAAVVLTPFAARSARRGDRLPKALVGRTMLAGALLALHFATWVQALKLTSVAAATALVTTQLLWVVLIDRLGGTKVSRAVLVGCGLSIIGVVTISGVDFSLSREALAGDVLAIVGGGFAAGYVIVGAGIRRTVSTTVYTTWCYGTCAVLLLVAAVLTGTSLTGFSAQAWALIAGVTVCAQFLGHSLLNHLLAVMSPLVVSLTLLLEVPGAAILAAVFLDEALPAGTYLGVGLMLAGLAVVVLTRREPLPDEPLVAD